MAASRDRRLYSILEVVLNALQTAVSSSRAHNDVVDFWTIQQCGHHVSDRARPNLGYYWLILQFWG